MHSNNIDIAFIEEIREFECSACRQGLDLDFEFTMAFQPLVDMSVRKVWGYEALVRGKNGESAYHVLSNVDESNKYRFDQACRVKAIALASELGLEGVLSINFMPNAVYDPDVCIRTTLKAAREYHFDIENIMFEMTETEKVQAPQHLARIVQQYNVKGFITALDDFGAGYAGLNLLAEFLPQIIKIDMQLVRSIGTDEIKYQIVKHIVLLAEALGIKILAEGVETIAEYKKLWGLGVRLYQGYLFAKPGFECLPEVDFAELILS